MKEESHEDHRNRSIKGAVLTSILSKFGTLLLRLISIPVAIRVLGMDQFGVYATILIAVQMMDIFHVGIGPALTQKLSKAVLAGDRDREACLFSTSIVLSSAITFGIALILWSVMWHVPVTELFGEKYAGFSDSMRRACLIGIVIIAVELVCLVAERGRDGYMETRYTNSWGAAGNFLGAGLLLIGIGRFPTIEFLVLAINGSVVLAKVGNMIHLFVQRPYLIPRPSNFSPGLIRSLLGGSVIFTVVYGLSGITEYNILAFLVARYLGPEQAANYSVLVTLHVSLAGIISMLTIPLWPAVIDAYERKDFEWVRKGAKKLRLIALAFGGGTFLGMALLGTWAVNLWVGEGFSLDSTAMAWFGLYFALHLWRHVNQILCLGVSRENAVSVVVLAETACSVAMVVWFLNQGHGITFVLATICLAISLFSSWMFPRIFRSTYTAAVRTNTVHDLPMDRSPEAKECPEIRQKSH